jgi:hypothetical protein
MVLTFQGISESEDIIAGRLKVKPGLGVPTRNIRLLASEKIEVIYNEGTLTDLQSQLDAKIPVIGFVQMGELSYWRGESFQHAVVIIGIEGDFILVLDPAYTADIVKVTVHEFLLAWLEMDYLYTVVKEKEQE